MRTLLLGVLAAGVLGFALTTNASAQSPHYPLPTQPAPPPPRTTPVVPPLQLMSPFPIVRIVGRLTRSGARIRILSVRAPVGAAILVRCVRRGCRRTQRRRGRGIDRAVRFRRFERRLRAGTYIEVRVSRGLAIGKYTRFRIRRGRRPARRDLCLRPGDVRGTRCPEL